ncbi:MAG: hypothetical protein EF813_01050 [Methanosarcinales archaeon]|nr:MAG: hypothetical protein EF813_01050 [Methanosarcinales archaeon]
MLMVIRIVPILESFSLLSSSILNPDCGQVEKKGWVLIMIEVRPDHIHLAIIGISHITRLSDVMKYLKGTSGLSLFKVFPKLR